MIDLPGGGSVRCAYDAQSMQKLVASCRDFAEGWYRPGWSEPADYDLAQLTAPIVDPRPQFDALYVWQSADSPLFGRSGDPLEIMGAVGDPLGILLNDAA